MCVNYKQFVYATLLTQVSHICPPRGMKYSKAIFVSQCDCTPGGVLVIR